MRHRPMLEVIEPATEQVLAELPEATADDVDAAVAAAKAAWPAWRAISPGDRAVLLGRIADAVALNADSLAEMEARNVGKPITDARDEMQGVAATFRYYDGAPERLFGKSIPVAGGIDVTFREPLGVVALIVPWNFPLAIASWKVAPALAAGNTVVLKPSELTPLTAMELQRLAVEAGLPEGVMHVLPGRGFPAGERLVTHPDVAKIAFTGSTAVGKRVHELASGTLKRLTLELGGKSANIVFADSDVEAAARAAPGAVFANAGQDCCARSRVLVQRSVLADFMSVLIDVTAAVTVGDPLEADTRMGPLISASQRERVARFVADDAPVSFQGEVPDRPGYWFPPTILHPVDRSSPAVREEIFGPVVAVIPFDDEDEAIGIANDTRYGLSGSIWTRDVGRAVRVARAIDSGNLSVNSNSSVRITTPFGGFKESGLGRELGPDALDHYTEVKNVFISAL